MVFIYPNNLPGGTKLLLPRTFVDELEASNMAVQKDLQRKNQELIRLNQRQKIN